MSIKIYNHSYLYKYDFVIFLIRLIKVLIRKINIYQLVIVTNVV